MIRTFDPSFFNEVANHPDVRPWLGGEGELDLSVAIRNPINFTLQGEGGGFVLMRHEPGIYEAHSLFLPGSRGQTVRTMRAGFDYMFTRTDCGQIVTQIPDNNPAAAALAKLARFRPMFRREDTPRGPTAYVGLTIDEWAQDTAALEEDGAWFHDGVEAAKIAQEADLPDHPHDPAHERAVGAAVRMVKAGNLEKAVIFYNRWARLAGYPLMALISEHPPVFDVGDAIATLIDGKMEILLCQ